MPQLRIDLTDHEAEVIERWARCTVITRKRSRSEAVKNALLVEAAFHLAAEAELAEESAF